MPQGRAVRSGTRADLFVLLVCAGLAFFLTVSPAGVRDAVAGALRRTVVSPLVSLQQRAELSRTAFLSYEGKIVAHDSVAMRALTAPALERENDRLRLLLGLAGRIDWGFIPAEALHGRAVDEEFTLTLTAGERAGVRPFSPVVAPEGLIGMVQTVDPKLSLAITWSHPDFRASAMAADGSAFGIVAAHLGSGPERYLLELRGVPFRSALKPGALITTSGLGGTYPRGIPIGSVLGELKTSEGWARTYLLRPAVLPPDVTSVMILKTERAAAGVTGVWGTLASADSAARRIAAAGDSLARTAALQEAAARQAALGANAPSAMMPVPTVEAPVDSAARAAAIARARARRARADSVRRDSIARANTPARGDTAAPPPTPQQQPPPRRR